MSENVSLPNDLKIIEDYTAPVSDQPKIETFTTEKNGAPTYPRTAMATLRTASFILGATLAALAVGAAVANPIGLAVVAGVAFLVVVAAAYKAAKEGIEWKTIAANVAIFGILGVASTGFIGASGTLATATVVNYKAMLAGTMLESILASYLETKGLNSEKVDGKWVIKEYRPPTDADMAKWRQNLMSAASWISEGLNKWLGGSTIKYQDTPLPPNSTSDMIKLRTAALNVGVFSFFIKPLANAIPFGKLIVLGVEGFGLFATWHYAKKAYEHGRSPEEIGINILGFTLLGGLAMRPILGTFTKVDATFASLANSAFTEFAIISFEKKDKNPPEPEMIKA